MYYENSTLEMGRLLDSPATRAMLEWPSSKERFFWSAFCNPTEKAIQLNNLKKIPIFAFTGWL